MLVYILGTLRYVPTLALVRKFSKIVKYCLKFSI